VTPIVGLWVPVVAAAGWIVVGSMVLTPKVRRASDADELFG
jgi:hypothetical protein